MHIIINTECSKKEHATLKKRTCKDEEKMEKEKNLITGTNCCLIIIAKTLILQKQHRSYKLNIYI